MHIIKYFLGDSIHNYNLKEKKVLFITLDLYVYYHIVGFHFSHFQTKWMAALLLTYLFLFSGAL